MDGTSNSVPDISEDEDESRINIYRKELEDLQTQLQNAHKEIELLSLENNNLKQRNAVLLERNKTYKVIASGPLKTKVQTPTKNTARTKTKQVQTSESMENTLSAHSINYCKEIKGDTLDKETQTPVLTYDTLVQKQNLTPTSHLGQPGGISRPKPKNRLAIMSSRCTKGVLPIIEEVFTYEFDYCHYLLHNATTEEWLLTVEDNIKDFTMQDYCLIFIGENDMKNNEYLDILQNLKNSLKNTTHTNIVICAPTYIRGALIHNYKVELFNNLLSLDIKNNEYAYFFDSNYTLSLDMFSYNTGKINKYGWMDIFSQIRSNIFADYDQDYASVSGDNVGMKSRCHKLAISTNKHEKNTLEIPQLLDTNMTSKQLESNFNDTDLTTNNMDLFRAQ